MTRLLEGILSVGLDASGRGRPLGAGFCRERVGRERNEVLPGGRETRHSERQTGGLSVSDVRADQDRRAGCPSQMRVLTLARGSHGIFAQKTDVPRAGRSSVESRLKH